MVTEQEKQAMLKAMNAMNNSELPVTDSYSKGKNTTTHANPDVDAMLKILENFHSATDSTTNKILSEDNIKDTIHKKQDSVIVKGLYEIKIEKEFWNKKKNKNYYSIFNHTGDCVFENVALFESAMFIIKNLIKEQYTEAKRIYKLDQDYIKHLRDMRFAKKGDSHIMEAKYSDAKYKMLEVKEQLKNCLFE